MPTVVKFNGGPFAGQAEVRDGAEADPVRGSGALMAWMAYQDYAAHLRSADDAKWVLCRVHSGRAAGPHFYKIASVRESAGRLEIVCEYGGTKYPAGRVV